MHNLTSEELSVLKSTLPKEPTAKDCIGCGKCCKAMPCGGGCDVKDHNGNMTCDKLVEVDCVDGQPQYRCRVFKRLIEDEFARSCLEPGEGCDYEIGTIVGSYPDRLKLLQGLQKRAKVTIQTTIA